jgi:hypothetical protein
MPNKSIDAFMTPMYPSAELAKVLGTSNPLPEALVVENLHAGIRDAIIGSRGSYADAFSQF